MEPGGDTTPGGDFVRSLAKGLAVIEAFDAQAAGLTLSDVAKRTGLARGTARRSLLTLVELGYAGFDGKFFSLRPSVLRLGFAYLSALPFWNFAEPIMEDLVEEVRESCSAAVLDDTDIVYVLRIPTHKIMAISLGIGSRLPAFCTSMGRVLLSDRSDAEIERILKRSDLRPRTNRTVTDRAELKRIIDDVRSKGWAMVNQELEEGLISISAPIRDRNDRVIAAMNVTGQANRTPATQMVKTFLPPLRVAADRITALLRPR